MTSMLGMPWGAAFESVIGRCAGRASRCFRCDMVQGWREIGDPFSASCGSAAADDTDDDGVLMEGIDNGKVLLVNLAAC